MAVFMSGLLTRFNIHGIGGAVGDNVPGGAAEGFVIAIIGMILNNMKKS